MDQKTFEKVLLRHRNHLQGIKGPRHCELADLQFLRLEGLNMDGANLQQALFMGASFFGVSMERADLRDADFDGCNLGDTNLQYALLQGADFAGAGLREANLKFAFYDARTVFPIGFDPITAGMILVDEEEKAAPSPNKQDDAAAALPKTLQEEFSELLANHGFDLTYFGRVPGKNEESVAHFARVVPTRVEGNPLTRAG